MLNHNIHSEVRLLILCAGDFKNERAFSGSARNLFNALEKRGCVYHKANVAGNMYAQGGLPTRIFRKLDRFNIENRYRTTSKIAYQINTLRARSTAKKYKQFNACLIYGTDFNPKLSVPTYCYFDATAAQVIAAKKWTYETAWPRTLNRIFGDQKKLFQSCAGVFPRSQWAGQSVLEEYELPQEKICVAGAGVNYQLDALPHQSYDKQTILFIGREFELKGGPLIVEAFRATRKILPKAKLVIIGCNPPIQEPGIEIVGPISKDVEGGLERILTYFSESSIFCLMSSFEAFGIALVEAMHCGVPCVVPKRYAFQEIVVDKVTGRHVLDPNPLELSRVFTELLSDPKRLKEMGVAGKEHVHRNYTWDAAAKCIHERIARDLTVKMN